MEEPETIKRYSLIQRYQLVGEFKNSGQTAAQFSREHGINLHTFKYWVYSEGWKYEDKRLEGFVELGRSEILTDSDKSILIKKAGVEVRVPAEISERNLVKILDAVATI
ncbi:MAG: hypothetical protein MJ182_10875 [Treponema sp.]|nr:hypothetical protein [archaeon]MCQ2574387.1 hypothetical protein [Treponema sp.]